MLYLIILQYLRPLQEVDALLPAHRQFLEQHYRLGHFVLSGRQAPRTGGIILAQAGSRDEVAAWLSEDPFHRAQVASYDILGWEPTCRADIIPSALAPDATVACREIER